MFDIAIIGVGATGINLLKEIQDQVYAFELKSPRIALFSPHESFGKGKVFGDADQVHKVNTPPHMLSVSTCEPAGFLQWMEQLNKVSEIYPNRLLYSRFLEETYRSMVSSSLLEIEEFQESVHIITRRSTFYRLQSQRNTIDAYKVILCVGSLHGSNFPEIEKCAGFIDHYSELTATNDARILIAGTGLSAVDMFRSINKEDNREIHLFSRNGLAPTCLAKEYRYIPEVFSWKTFLDLKAKEKLVRLQHLLGKLKQEIQRIPNGGERGQAMKIFRDNGLLKSVIKNRSKYKHVDFFPADLFTHRAWIRPNTL